MRGDCVAVGYSRTGSHDCWMWTMRLRWVGMYGTREVFFEMRIIGLALEQGGVADYVGGFLGVYLADGIEGQVCPRRDMCAVQQMHSVGRQGVKQAFCAAESAVYMWWGLAHSE